MVPYASELCSAQPRPRDSSASSSTSTRPCRAILLAITGCWSHLAPRMGLEVATDCSSPGPRGVLPRLPRLATVTTGSGCPAAAGVVGGPWASTRASSRSCTLLGSGGGASALPRSWPPWLGNGDVASAGRLLGPPPPAAAWATVFVVSWSTSLLALGAPRPRAAEQSALLGRWRPSMAGAIGAATPTMSRRS